MSGTVADQAEILAAGGDTREALRLLEDRAGRSDVYALYALGVWHLAGDYVERDLLVARSWLRRATEVGHVDAALMEVALTANGSGAPADWAGALKLLRAAARNDPLAAEHLTLIEAMAIDAAGVPAIPKQTERLASAPDTLLFRALLTPAECAHIASASNDMLEPSIVVDPASGRYVAHPVRTSYAATIGPAHETLVVQAINRRLAVASGTNLSQGEPLTVQRYTQGQQYRPHHDTLPPQVANGNQRRSTMLCYLNTEYGGGETRFTASGRDVRGGLGDVLLFANTKPDGAPDPAAQHAGLPVTRGAKWLATRWLRELPYDPWTHR